jgi:hypothetical protein
LNSKLLTQLTGKALDLLDRHPRRVTGALAALLLGTGVTAFGVAPQLPDPADQPVTTVVETVQPLPVAQQTEVLLGHRFNLFRTELTRSSDTADSLLARLGISDAQAASFLRKDAMAKAHLLGTGSRSVTAEADDEQRLLKLSMRWASGDPHFFKRLVIERQGAGFAARVETAPYARSTRLVAGEIHKSLEGSIERAGLIVTEGVQPSPCKKSGLTHAAPEHLAPAAGASNRLGRSQEQGTHRCAQPFGQTHRNGIEMGADLPSGVPCVACTLRDERSGSIEKACAVEMGDQTSADRELPHRFEVVDGQNRTACGVFQGNQSGAGEVRIVGLDRRLDRIEGNRRIGGMLERLGLNRTQDSHAAAFPAIGVPLLTDDRLVTSLALGEQRDQIGLSA